MIPVRGYEGEKVAVLGLGRSGLATARALEAGGATALCWDDGTEARARAGAAGLTLHDLTRREAFEGVAALVTSPGIPHLYPETNKHIARAYKEGIPVDNDTRTANVLVWIPTLGTINGQSRTAISDITIEAAG